MKKHVGKGKSTYRLYVVFKLEYQNPRKEYNYFSDDRPNAKIGIKRLLKRVLLGTCKGRYELAMLYLESTNECKAVYLPNEPVMTYEEYKKRNSAKIGPEHSAYRLYVKFLPAFQKPRESFNYFSDDSKGSEVGKAKLLRLRRKLEGRYEVAILVEVRTNQTLETWS